MPANVWALLFMISNTLTLRSDTRLSGPGPPSIPFDHTPNRGVVRVRRPARRVVERTLNLVLRTSGDERLEARAAQSAKQGGWIKLPEFESTTPRLPPSEPQIAVDQAEIDRWIELMGSGSDCAVDKVVSFGEPALRRLFELEYGDASVPRGEYVKDAYDGRDRAFARLTKRYPELALELVRGRPSMPFPVMAAFRTWGDERLKMIADIASKNNMRVKGLTS